MNAALLSRKMNGPTGLRALAREWNINPKGMKKLSLVAAIIEAASAETEPETAETAAPEPTPEPTEAAEKPARKWNNNALITTSQTDLAEKLWEALESPMTISEIHGLFAASGSRIRPGAVTSRLGTYTRRGLFVKTVETENGRKVGYYQLSAEADRETFDRRFVKVR